MISFVVCLTFYQFIALQISYLEYHATFNVVDIYLFHHITIRHLLIMFVSLTYRLISLIYLSLILYFLLINNLISMLLNSSCLSMISIYIQISLHSSLSVLVFMLRRNPHYLLLAISFFVFISVFSIQIHLIIHLLILDRYLYLRSCFSYSLLFTMELSYYFLLHK